MTTRLKKKLNDLGVDTSSKKANESFVQFGTPLPSLDKNKDLNEFVPLWKQEMSKVAEDYMEHSLEASPLDILTALDRKKARWTPSTFVSSRNDKAQKKQARPEDFMDEEDLQEIRDNMKFVDDRDQMDFEGSTSTPQVSENDESIANALRALIIPPTQDSAGGRLLKKMGWRPGHGIGPRVSYERRRQQDKEAGILSNLPEDDEEAKKHTYLPRDIPVISVKRKTNSHGLGYDPGMGLNESLGVKETQSGPQLSAGFGLGALNDADEDDLDVYDSAAGTSSRSRIAYDGLTGDDETMISIGARSQKSLGKQRSLQAPDQQSQSVHGLIPGFVMSSKPVVEDKLFPIPDAPKGWKPDPRRVWNKEKSGYNGSSVTRLTAKERGEVLGEAPLPARSVFDYLSKKDRDRLQNFQRPPPTGESLPGSEVPAPPQEATTIVIPRIELHVAGAALKGFQPFTADRTKHARYTAYLQSQADPNSPPSSLLRPLVGQSIGDFNKELADYEKSALLFRPISGAMANRFTSAAVVDHGPKILEGPHQPVVEEEPEPPSKEQMEEELRLTNPKAHAAQMGMYGALTREVKAWQPAKLLCKRFGVKEPEPPAEATEDVQMKPSEEAFEEMKEEYGTAPLADEEVHNGPRDLANIGLGEDPQQLRDILTYKRPPMDVFKAIFASDEEDSDDEPEAQESLPDIKPTTTAPSAIPLVDPSPPPPPPAVDATPVDLATFKPTFVPREKRKTSTEEDGGNKKKQRKKDKKASKVLVSFGDDDDVAVQPVKKKKKSWPKVEEKVEDDDEMWVEKPTPAIVNPIVAEDNQSSLSARPHRKRAADFL